MNGIDNSGVAALKGLPIGNGQPSALSRFRGATRETLCRILDFFRVPGFVRKLEFHDKLTNTNIKIEPSFLFTVISINGRDYYFRRLSGRFDGTGSGCLSRCDHCTLDRVR